MGTQRHLRKHPMNQEPIPPALIARATKGKGTIIQSWKRKVVLQWYQSFVVDLTELHMGVLFLSSPVQNQ